MNKMKANAYLEILTTKTKATFNIYVERTSNEIFNMGNSSFFINLNKMIFTNGKLKFACKKYSTKVYEPIEFKHFHFGCFAIQIRCKNGIGKEITGKRIKIASVQYKYIGNPSNISWRLADTAVVTPSYQSVETNYIMNFK